MTNGNLPAEITKRAAKASGKYRHWWNIKYLSGNEQSLNLEQIYDFEIQQNIRHESDLLQQLSRLSLKNIPTDTEPSQDENQIHETLLAKNKYDILKVKQVELDYWKNQDVYMQHIDEGQNCYSLRWVLKEKLANG